MATDPISRFVVVIRATWVVFGQRECLSRFRISVLIRKTFPIPYAALFRAWRLSEVYPWGVAPGFIIRAFQAAGFRSVAPGRTTPSVQMFSGTANVRYRQCSRSSGGAATAQVNDSRAAAPDGNA